MKAIYDKDKKVYLCACCGWPLISKQDAITYLYMFNSNKSILLACSRSGLANVVVIEEE